MSQPHETAPRTTLPAFAGTPASNESTWRAPGRVNLIGEHTDYNDGFVLPLAIPQGCTARVRRIDDPVLRLRSAQEGRPVEVALDTLRPGTPDGWAAYPAGVVWALRESGHDVGAGGLDVEVDGDVPSGAGLSSSAALECSVGGAAADVLGVELSGPQLVALARRAENDFVGAPTGGMDQLASVLSVADTALFCDMRDLRTEPVPFDLATHDLSLLVADTHAPHRHVDGEYGARRRSCEQAAAILAEALHLRPAHESPTLRDVPPDLDTVDAVLREATPGDDTLARRARHVLTENERVQRTADLLRGDRIADIGALLTASQVSMRDDFEITVPEVDVAVDAAVGAGALGARMTGGGFGGCVIALVQAAHAAAVHDAIVSAFAQHEFTAPTFVEVAAARGAHRLAGA